MKTQVPPPLLVIVGETASGKTELAIRLAQRFDGEIICADSWTVRRGLDIGTAKPSAAEQAAVPHHLLDVVGPDEDFTAVLFKQLANEAIADIDNRGKLPIMVGGTGLYVDGVVYDYSFLPAGDGAERERLNGLSVDQLLAEIEAEGIELGDVDVRNKRRLIRLIETAGARPQKAELRANTLMIGLEAEGLKARMEARVDAMLAAGLEGEVQTLAERYGWNCEALKGIGYAQWRGYFAGLEDHAQVRQRILKATIELARRQRAWFRRNKSIRWFAIPVNWTEVVDYTTTFLQP